MLRSLRYITLSALLALPMLLASQTCRMRVQLDAAGQRIEYREVYQYDYVWEKPCFPGGDGSLMNFINKHRNYPKKAYKAGIEGRVTCAFIINADGSVSDVQVVKGVETSLNEEAIRVLRKMPAWSPGRINGQPVPVRVIRVVPFRK